MLFLFHTVIAKPFLAGTAMAHRGAGFFLSQIPHNPVWSAAAKDSSSVHASDLKSLPKRRTCQNPNVVQRLQGRAE